MTNLKNTCIMKHTGRRRLVILCQFSFQNYKSYKSETTFDFQATSIPEFSDSLLKGDKGSALLPVGVIYGPNGGGKSNLLLALSSLITMVVKPIHDLGKNRQNRIIQQQVGYAPFLFDDDSRTQPTEFEIFFRQGKNEYRYDLALLQDEVISESLYWRAVGGKKQARFLKENARRLFLAPRFIKQA